MSAVDYEMLVSHSPPIFAHSPPAAFLTDYPYRRSPPPTCRPIGFAVAMPASPKRPCLVIRADDTQDDGPTSPTRLKKRVVFADDKGMSLTHVRLMTEPSHVPPIWSVRFLGEVSKSLAAAQPTAPSDGGWESRFVQPAAAYVDFRRRLDADRVCLESAVLRPDRCVLVGTVKVSNIGYSKEVFLRVTFDEWRSHEDAFCRYVPTPTSNNCVVLFDTFSFEVPVRPDARRVEFCVGFRCNGQEFWDNNRGTNYAFIRKAPVHASTPTKRFAEAVDAKLDSWSEFASWTHLENSAPYW